MAMEVSNVVPEMDNEGQQYLDIQRRAAAVQLHHRSLAIAHLRAQLVMPRGETVRTQPSPKPVMKQEDGSYQAVQRQPQPRPAQEHAQPAIIIQLTTPASDPQQESSLQHLHQPQPQQIQHCGLKPRQLVHRIPDAAAVQRFRADGPPDYAADVADLAAQHAASLLPAPRIVADPTQVNHQLAGWVRAAGEGPEAEVTGAGKEGVEDEGLVRHDVAELEDDLMDEEEWV